MNWNTAVNKPNSNTDENAAKYPSKMELILSKDLCAKLVTKFDRRLFSGLEDIARMGAVKPRVKANEDSEAWSRTGGVKAEVLSSTEADEEEASYFI